jgi:ectoine hydroxylase-related dioxygenase (phytanoyl-CoA dioxygenase family)
LGKDAKVVRAIFFDKTPEANWKVPWHQDLTIAVMEKRETENFTAWTRKAGIWHVQPATAILQKMLTLRFHLDDADETNGALKVVAGSHRRRLSSAEVQKLPKPFAFCRASKGDVLLMRPLVVHSSSAGTSPKHRRVIHFEFSAENLPNNLDWYGS